MIECNERLQLMQSSNSKKHKIDSSMEASVTRMTFKPLTVSRVNPNEKVCVWICLTLESQMTRSALRISLWVIYVWLCRDSTVLYLSGRQFMSDSAENLFFTQGNPVQRIVQLSDAFRQVLLCRARSNIFIRELLICIWPRFLLFQVDVSMNHQFTRNLT